MILETAKYPNELNFRLDFRPGGEWPNWVNVLALIWLLLEDAGKLLAPRLVCYQVLALVQCDRGQKVVTREIENYSFVWAIGRAFCCFYLVFLGISALEGVLKWLQ